MGFRKQSTVANVRTCQPLRPCVCVYVCARTCVRVCACAQARVCGVGSTQASMNN